jgi:hypothetical protein
VELKQAALFDRQHQAGLALSLPSQLWLANETFTEA